MFLASWTGHYLNEALLWWALGGYVVFALLHATLAFWPGAEAPASNGEAWQSYGPLLPLVLICLCVGKHETSAAVWICVLALDFIAIAVAFARRSLPAISIALVITIYAAGLWISQRRRNRLRAFLIVAAGSGTFFFAAALFAARRLFLIQKMFGEYSRARGFDAILLLSWRSRNSRSRIHALLHTAFFLAVLLSDSGSCPAG